MSQSPSVREVLRTSRGVTLIELVTALSVAAFVVGSLYLLLGASIKGRLIIHARVAEQERGRLALGWLADRVRQISYAPDGPCPDGLVRIGDGSGFDQRFVFRAVVDESAAQPRRIYAYYLENGTLWQETRLEDAQTNCLEEAERAVPHAGRVALVAGTVKAFDLVYLDRHSQPTTDRDAVRAIRMTLHFQAEASPGRIESQAYHTVVSIRGP